MTTLPGFWGLPWPEFRPGQLEAIENLVSARQAYSLLEANTGLGKSAFPRALSTRGRTMVLCNTLNLQRQYRDQLDAKLLYGRANYDCVHPEAYGGQSTAQCLVELLPGGMFGCPHIKECLYVLAKQAVQKAQFSSLNYAMFHVSRRWVSAKPPEFLVLDECHTLKNQVIDWASMIVTTQDIALYHLELPPRVALRPIGGYITPAEVGALEEWFDLSIRKVEHRIAKLSDGKPEHAQPLGAAVFFLDRLTTVRNLLPTLNEHWFVSSGDTGSAARTPGLTLKPYTAQFHFQKLFDVGSARIIMQSATVGDFGQFLSELGLTLPEVQTLTVASEWTAAMQPIYFARKSPGLASTLNDVTRDFLGAQIPKYIQSKPSTWSGLIHTVRRDMADSLRRLLIERDPSLASRLVLPTSVDDFQRQLARKPNLIAITHLFHTGVDLPNVNMLFVTKIPFGNLGDPFVARQCDYDPIGYRAAAARELQQMLGRTRRGSASHYDLPGKPSDKLVVVLDGHLRMVKQYLSPLIQQAIVEPSF
ncbi:MAG: hypothetical protein IPO08_22795 [Xanthomonadales bacterium]|nr:hypothetical protein [Xanthomonadales bacterium]